jgi:hypothetical protein
VSERAEQSTRDVPAGFLERAVERETGRREPEMNEPAVRLRHVTARQTPRRQLLGHRGQQGAGDLHALREVVHEKWSVHAERVDDGELVPTQ